MGLLHFLQAGLLCYGSGASRSVARCVGMRIWCRHSPGTSGSFTWQTHQGLRIYARVQHGMGRAMQWAWRPFQVRRAVGLLVGPALVTLGGHIVYCQLDFNENNHLFLEPKRKPDVEPQFSWPEFWKLLRPQLQVLLTAVLLAFGAAILNIQIPLMLGELVNVVSRYTREYAGNYLRDVREPALRLLSLYALQGFLTSGYIVLLSRVGERVAATMRKALFRSLLRQDLAFFDANKTGMLVNRLTSDIQEFKSSFKQVISQGLRSLTQIAGCFISLYLISPRLTGLLVVVLPTLVGAGALIGSFLRTLSRRAQEQVAKATGVADEALGNVRTVRAFAMESREEELYSAEVDKSCQVSEILGMGIAVFQGLSNLVLNCVVLGTIFAGGAMMAGNKLSAGDLMSFLVASQTVQSYPTRPGHEVLKNFSLTLPPYKTVAIVGQSGGGKSTVAALLERFYDPNQGAVTLDGIDIRMIDPSWLRGQAIGFISQEPVLFGTTIMENIRFGKPDASDEEVYAAAEQANADCFIRTFPEGYNTVVGERGVTLSGGQKQRVAIARALIKNPRILILDEATSALDAESERVVQAALDRATTGRTVLVIAHRLSTIMGADFIVVLSQGKVAEAGTHSVLLQKGGLYAELIHRQAKEQK
ncbi:ATP-binding cassette sub-family B member 8, mitochondrial isoform X4 [Rhinatrema bivittatum]|uniref:ATP-binding cassette sub-family B member 8, mitochondrial isoform X4 n=1 Tax=Rhinatrema bivittatum TaxID=194408 RepID=UPI0011281B25|nr:ATP-binding cassette sub-family B member 8, mitochondrial isoform X4 [Rhinatrema bivittatum]